jgi:hypothetical protein
MPEAYIRRGSALAPNQYNKPQANTIRVHSTTDEVKVGTGASGNTELTLVDTTTAQTLTNKTFQGLNIQDTGGVNRAVFNPTAKTIVDGSATSLFEVPIAAGGYAGGVVHFVIFAGDGTDRASRRRHRHLLGRQQGSHDYPRSHLRCGQRSQVGVDRHADAQAWTATDDTNKMTVKVQPTGSLTETTYTIVYTVFPHIGTVTIL